MNKTVRIAAIFVIALILLYAHRTGLLAIVPGPEGVDASLYSAVSNGEINVAGTSMNLNVGVGQHSVLGKVAPMTWIAYTDYTQGGWVGGGDRRIGYQWVRVDPKTAVIRAVIVDRGSGAVTDGVTLTVRVNKPSMEDVNSHGDPLGRNPTQIDWFSYETQKTESGTNVTWKHYEVYVVPIDFYIELSINPATDLSVGDFRSFDLWFVVDTVSWLNSFTRDQYELLKNKPAEDVKIAAYEFRGGFPIWAWVGQWNPWTVTGRDGSPDKYYDPADISPAERSELMQHLQVMPSFAGSEVSLYTEASYKYDRLFSADIIKNPSLLNSTLASNIKSLPDPRFSSTVYIPITLINYGALKHEEGWLLTYSHKEFYPVSTLRIRLLYAIYGEWTFLWTKQLEKKFEYKFESKQSTITGDKSTWQKFTEGVGSAATNPWTLLWTSVAGFFMILIALVVVAIFAPGFLTALGSLMRRRGEK